MTIEYKSNIAAPPFRRIVLRYLVVVACNSFAGLFGWCLNDYFCVKFAPYRLQDPNWIDLTEIIVYFVVVFVAAMIIFRGTTLFRRIMWTIGATASTAFLLIPLVGCIGVNFHLWIGGRL
jgi:hypothetical protein